MQNKIVYVICEGDSEEAFLQELNKYLKDKEIKLTFIIFNVGTGYYNQVKAKYNEVKKRNRSQQLIAIWVDKDIYLRNDKDNLTKYNNRKGVPSFCFTYMNYEDFLTLHNNEKLDAWTDMCCRKNHFKTPVHSTEYMPLFVEKIFPNYKKGELPFEMNGETLKILFRNNRKAEGNPNAIHCEFISYLDNLFAKNLCLQDPEFYEPRE